VRDTTTLAERALITAVSRKAATYSDVLLRYAVEFERRTPGLRPDFAVTPPMRQELYDRLRRAGVEVTPEQWAGGQRWIDLQIGNEIAISRFGRAVAAQRNDGADKTLQQAHTQAALFREAEAAQRVAQGQPALR